MKAYLEPDEVTLMEAAASNLRDRLLIRILFHLGCRISEALSLVVEDIDFERGLITIKHLKAHLILSCTKCHQGLGRSHAFCPKCGEKIKEAQIKEQKQYRQRALPVDDQTLRIAKEYIQRGGPVIRNGKQLLFGVNRHRGWQVIHKCAEMAGLPKLINPETGNVHNVSPHKLRDSFAVMAMKQNDTGDGLRLLQEHLGHQSFNTTAKYRKVAGEEHRQWYENLWSKGQSK